MVRSPGGTKRNLSFGSHSSNTFVTRTNKISKLHHSENRHRVDFLELFDCVSWPLLTLIESDDTWCNECDMSHCVCQARDWQGQGCQPPPDSSAPHGRAAKQSQEFHFRLFSILPWRSLPCLMSGSPG